MSLGYDDLVPSPMAKAFIYESRHLGVSGVNVEQMVMVLEEAINVAHFENAWQDVAHQHEALRFTYAVGSDEALTFSISDTALFDFDYFDLRSESETEKKTIVLRHLRQDRKKGFKFNGECLFRIALFHMEDSKNTCLWTFHHALLDGNSFIQVIEDLFTFYEQRAAAKEPEIIPQGQYVQFLRWLQQIDHAAAIPYWEKLLQGCENACVPVIYSRGGAAETKGNKNIASSVLSKGVHSQLIQLSQQSQWRLNNVFQAAWALLLARYCDTDDVLFAAVRAGRQVEAVPAWETVGLFMNTCPMRMLISDDASVEDLVLAFRQQQLSHRPHEHTPIPKIAAAAGIPAANLFGTLLMYSEQPLNTILKLKGGKWHRRHFELYEHSSFPLECIVYAGEKVEITIEGDTSRYCASSIQELATSFEYLLEQFAEDFQQPLSNVQLLTEEEYEKQIYEFNLTGEHFKGEPSVIEAVRAKVSKYARKTALIEGAKHYTYSEVWEHSQRVSSFIAGQYIGRESLVAVKLGRSAQSIIALLGVMRAGAAFLTLSDQDPEERIRFKLKDSTAKLIIVADESEKTRFASGDYHIETFDNIIHHESGKNDNIEIAASDLAYVIYTSGTTGLPKGVMVEQGNLLNHCNGITAQMGLTGNDRVLQFANHTFDVALEEIFPSLMVGATIVLRSEDAIASAQTFLSFIEKNAISLINIPTAFWHHLVERVGGYSWPKCLRLMIVGGEEVSASALRKWRRQSTDHIRWLNGYGPTETTITSTVFEDSVSGAHMVKDSVPIGRPLPNVSHYILDKKLQPLPIGCPGQLHIGGAGVARGYLNRGTLSKEKFIPKPFARKKGFLYATGDKAYYLPDGTVVYLGRIDRQVKVRGFRVELGEIEVIALKNTNVMGCVVEHIEESESLVAYIVCRNVEQDTVAELIGFFKQSLPDYMVPAQVKIVKEIPLNSAGKLDRSKVAELEIINEYAPQESVGPRDEVEEILHEIWAEKLAIESFGIDQSFFELGGHSLLAVQMFADVEQEFNIVCDVREFFGEPTIERLARGIREEMESPTGNAESESQSAAKIIPLQEEGEGIPLYCICGIDLYRQLAASLGPIQPVYGVFLPVEAQMIESFAKNESFVFSSVKEMAKGYVEAIVEHNTLRRCGLAGVSFGGLLAYEIAIQLKEKGFEISYLCLMESFLASSIQQQNGFRWVWDHMVLAAKNPINFFNRIKNFRNPAFRRKQKVHMELRLNSMDDVVTQDFEELRWQAYHNAAHQYTNEVRKYEGSALLFKAEIQPDRPGYRVDSTYGWADLVQGGLQVFSVPGDHLGVLQAPNVGVLARKLLPTIKKANSN